MSSPSQEAHSIRRTISVECGGDPKKVFDYYVAHQEKTKQTGKYRFVDEPRRRGGRVNVADSVHDSKSKSA